LALVGASVGIEFLQGFVGRDTDLIDGLANASGVAVGAFLGVVARGVYAFLRSEFVQSEVRRNTVTLQAGDVLFREGEPSDRFYVVKSGLIRVIPSGASETGEPALAGPGEVIGVMGVIQGTPYAATATAAMPSRVYGMDARRLMGHADGKELPTITVLRVLAQRLRQANRSTAPSAASGSYPTTRQDTEPK
jgi:CRP-like cAMP-binding protein